MSFFDSLPADRGEWSIVDIATLRQAVELKAGTPAGAARLGSRCQVRPPPPREVRARPLAMGARIM